MKCPKCSGRLHRSKVPKPIILYCDVCDVLYRWSESAEGVVPFGRLCLSQRNSIMIPELKEGTKVYIRCKDHRLFLEQGVVVNRDHEHYRVRFVSLDKDIDGKMIWFPRQSVGGLPGELCEG